ncbi:MAG: metallophosphoesterase [Oscillospiraceae bacterium]|nr:metallophosphoesterase [Oscillospiraceae bacterium]
MKILHAADLHLDTPFTGRPPILRQELLAVPGKLATLCKKENCDIMLLSGDLFDGPHSKQSLDALRQALEEAAVPVFISPGNHDFCATDSPYLTAQWPKNVHIFTNPTISSLPLEALDCRIYGAGFRSMDCDALLEGFRAEGDEKYHIAILHGDPTQLNSPYNPITGAQIRESGLHYLALGHIHKTGSLRFGETLCAWPGCPMGRGWDELGPKGVLIVTIDATVDAEFVSLDCPQHHDIQIPGEDAQNALAALLPAVGNGDHYRVTLTGEATAPDLDALRSAFAHFPYLQLRDQTVPPVDIWSCVDSDSLEGVYFGILKNAAHQDDTRDIATLAAKISRKILDGQEVVLP